ncbi:MAG TPA: hypothetical protein GXX14_01610 [Clostridiaceae bacterium]|nr:hypothetical protein [Clostridiaceae bacterium]
MENNSLKAYFRIIKGLAEKRKKEALSILDSNDESLVKQRIQKLKTKYLSMLDTTLFELPSKVVKVGEIKCGGYRIEKLVMESLKNYYVPINLYIPDGCSVDKKPAILVNMGHYIEGKSLPENQIMCANLALQGFIVLTFDAVCQGERDMFPERIDKHSKRDMWVVEQHMRFGNQCYLMGYNSINYFLNDAKKAVDYLVSRQDVDTGKIGVTGQSGGGTVSYLLAAYDDRIKAVAPIQCISTMERICKGDIGDSEQSMINMLYERFDIADFLWMIPPRPLFISAGIKDFFSIEGVREVCHELKKVYKLLGIEENMELCEIDVEHIISKEVRNSIYLFFNRLFIGTGNIEEKDITIFSHEQLSCGIANLNGMTPLDCNKRMLERLILERPKENNTTEGVEKALRQLIPLNEAVFETVSDSPDKGHDGYRYLIFKDEYDLCFQVIMNAKDKDADTVIYIDMEDSIDIKDKASGCQSNTVVIKPFGSSNDSYKLSTEYDDETRLAYQGIVSGRNIFGIRLGQVVYALDFLSREGISGNIEIHGIRQGALLGLFACLLRKNVMKAHCEELISSFSSLFNNKNYLLNETDIVPGILKQFDIDMIIKMLGDRVNIISYVDEMKRVIPV